MLFVRSGDEYDTTYDSLMDAIDNEAPVLESYYGHGYAGEFPIQIRGFDGVYFISASEFDDIGFYDTLVEARDELFCEYDTFMQDSDDAVEDNE